jgi:hypothetical protein
MEDMIKTKAKEMFEHIEHWRDDLLELSTTVQIEKKHDLNLQVNALRVMKKRAKEIKTLAEDKDQDSKSLLYKHNIVDKRLAVCNYTLL